MSVREHITQFAGYPVLEWNPNLESVDNPSSVAVAIRLTWEDNYWEQSGGDLWMQRFNTFLTRPYVTEIQALVVGMWGQENVDEIVEAIANHHDSLPNLKAIFLGDITPEENEISWIEQGDMSPLFNAYPNLEHFAVRGGRELELGQMDLPHLKSLRIETGGMDRSNVQSVLSAKLPALETLVLWLGHSHYGANTTLQDLKPFYDPQQFPKLKYLGLCNCEYTDEIAIFMATAPLLQRLEVLDLSMGTFSDEGALALLTSPYILHLKKLDVNHHFCSTIMIEKLRELGALGVTVNVSGQNIVTGDDSRFVAVGE